MGAQNKNSIFTVLNLRDPSAIGEKYSGSIRFIFSTTPINYYDMYSPYAAVLYSAG